MRKKILLIGSGVLLLACLVVGSVGRAFPAGISPSPQALADRVELGFDSTRALSQTFNNCAPYSAAAVIFIARHLVVDPELLAGEMTWRTKRGLTYPFGLLDLLAKYHVGTDEFQLANLTSAAKLGYLRQQLMAGKPLIILGKVHGVRHYIVLVGYASGVFHVYDPLTPRANQINRVSVDFNRAAVGNKTFTDAELLNFWSGGAAGLFFNYWGIGCF